MGASFASRIKFPIPMSSPAKASPEFTLSPSAAKLRLLKKAALHVALRKKCVGVRGGDGSRGGRGGARIAVRSGRGGGGDSRSRLPRSRPARLEAAAARTSRTAGAAYSGACRRLGGCGGGRCSHRPDQHLSGISARHARSGDAAWHLPRIIFLSMPSASIANCRSERSFMATRFPPRLRRLRFSPRWSATA